MSKICQITGKKAMIGNNVSHSKRKKTVASLHDGSKEGRAYTKVIKMVKSPKTGAYIFDEQMVPNEKVQDFFKK